MLRGVYEATKMEDAVVNNPNPLCCPLVADFGIIRSIPREIRPVTARFGGTPAYPWLATVQQIIADPTTSSKVPCANQPSLIDLDKADSSAVQQDCCFNSTMEIS